MEDNIKNNGEALLGKKLDLLLRTGQLLIQSLADSNRIDRNLRRVAIFMGIPMDKFHMHISYTTLMININEGSRSITKFQKCTTHGVNMSALSEISTLSWNALEKNYTLEQYEEELEAIASRKRNYPRWLVVLGIGLACAGFCKLFGCDWPAFLITTIASSAAIYARQEMHHRNFNLYVTIALSAFVAVSIACIGSMLDISSTPLHPLFASVLFLIPGVPLINSVDDMIDGFTILGFTRALIAFFTIGAISFGMIFTLKLFRIESYSAVLIPHSEWYIIAIAAAIAAAGFAILFNVPKRTLAMCAMGGAIAIVTRNVLMYNLGWDLPSSSFIGALVVGVVSNFLMSPAHVPAKVIAVPPVIPMIPGVLMYKTMIGIIGIDATKGLDQVPLLLLTMESGIKATMTILCISLGVALPNVIARRYFEKKKRQRLESAILRT